MRSRLGEAARRQSEASTTESVAGLEPNKGRNVPRSILDRSFQYTPSSQTDLKKTFAKIRREQRAQEEQNRKAADERLSKVAAIRQSKGA